jgi:hypothetical protein
VESVSSFTASAVWSYSGSEHITGEPLPPFEMHRDLHYRGLFSGDSTSRCRSRCLGCCPHGHNQYCQPANCDVVKLLKRGSATLVDVQDAFHNVLEKRKEEGARIEITCFYELLPYVRSPVVPKESATMSGELNYPIHANHRVSETLVV